MRAWSCMRQQEGGRAEREGERGTAHTISAIESIATTEATSTLPTPYRTPTLWSAYALAPLSLLLLLYLPGRQLQLHGLFPRWGRTGASHHYAFVEFRRLHVAKVVVEAMNGYIMFRR